MTSSKYQVLSEQEIINSFFNQKFKDAKVTVGIGDDTAVVSLGDNTLITCDTLVANTHFYPKTDPYYLGRKSLAVNLSDIIAMGGTPKYAIMSLTLPNINKQWLRNFTKGFFSLANENNIKLIGGDLVKGNDISITITLIGKAGKKIIQQSGASVNDDIWVSGIIGQAVNEFANNIKASNSSALHNPQPPVALAKNLANFATCAMDLSDSIIQSVAHLAKQNNLAFEIIINQVPLLKQFKHLPYKEIIEKLSFGEDYQILFTANPKKENTINKFSKTSKIKLTKIGKVTNAKNSYLKFKDQNIAINSVINKSFNHFINNQEFNIDEEVNKLTNKLANLCVKKSAIIAVAESCTGGLLAAKLTELPGSSRWFYGGTIVYDNSFKAKLLNISSQRIKRYGEVSKVIAQDLCQASLKLPKATHAVGITGWAGPSSGDKQNKGLVYIACGTKKKILVNEYNFKGNRENVRKQAVLASIKSLISLLNNTK